MITVGIVADEKVPLRVKNLDGSTWAPNRVSHLQWLREMLTSMFEEVQIATTTREQDLSALAVMLTGGDDLPVVDVSSDNNIDLATALYSICDLIVAVPYANSESQGMVTPTAAWTAVALAKEQGVHVTILFPNGVVDNRYGPKWMRDLPVKEWQKGPGMR